MKWQAGVLEGGSTLRSGGSSRTTPIFGLAAAITAVHAAYRSRPKHVPHAPPYAPRRAQAALFVQEQRSREFAHDKMRINFEGPVVTVSHASCDAQQRCSLARRREGCKQVPCATAHALCAHTGRALGGCW